MKRLLNSSKFWLSVIGSVFGVLAFKLTGSQTIAVMILSAFGLGIAGNAAEDVAERLKSIPGGGIKPPNDNDDNDEDNGGN